MRQIPSDLLIAPAVQHDLDDLRIKLTRRHTVDRPQPHRSPPRGLIPGSKATLCRQHLMKESFIR